MTILQSNFDIFSVDHRILTFRSGRGLQIISFLRLKKTGYLLKITLILYLRDISPKQQRCKEEKKVTEEKVTNNEIQSS